jgi:hypothetical protein
VVSAITSLGVAAKLMLFVTAVGLGSLVTVGVKTVVTSPRAVVVAPALPQPASPAAPVTSREPEAPVVEAPAPVVEAPAPVVEAPAPVVEVAPEPAPAPVAPPTPHVAARPLSRATPQPAPTLEPAPETPALPPPPIAPTEKTGVVEATSEEGFSTVVEVNFSSCDAATEAKVAGGARKLLTEQRAEHALWLLSAYQRHCPSGRWSDEAWRVRLSSLCLIGRNTEAASLLEWLTTEYPQRRASITSELAGTCDAEVLGAIP